jgi:hypothetical protein
MKPGEAARFACDECGIAFDLTIAPLSEWVEQHQDKDADDYMIGPPERCPFCDLAELRRVHDRPTIIG